MQLIEPMIIWIIKLQSQCSASRCFNTSVNLLKKTMFYNLMERYINMYILIYACVCMCKTNA